MNQLKNKSYLIAFVASVFFFTNCSKENEQVAPQTPNAPTDELAQAASKPMIMQSPVVKEDVVDLSKLSFPKRASSGARTLAGVTDYVDFDDQMALQIVPEQAKHTFATWPFYIQQVGNGWIHVKENDGAGYNANFRSQIGHYHLSYQNFVPCVTNGTFGKPSGNNCLAINPVLEPRTLDTHVGNQWIKIYAYDYNNSQRVFDLLGLKVTNGPIQLWFKKQGVWYHWSSLGTNTWNTSAYSTGITEVLIAGTGTTSIGIDNVKVNMPYN
jgi:hypothetical protein